MSATAIGVPRRRSSTWRRLLRRQRMLIGLGLTLFVVLVALIGPLFAPHSSTEIVGAPFAQPSADYLLGTDQLGRDVLSRTLNGGLTVIWMATAAATLGMLAGVAIGLFAGYSRSWRDTGLMRSMDVVQAFPHIVLVLLFVSLLGASLPLIVLLVAIAWMPQVARVTRGITLEVVERDFVRAQEIIGTPTRRIIWREILPNLTSPLLVEYALRLTWSVALIAALSFIGFGIDPPTADWGLMISENRGAIAVQPWAVVAPIVCISLITVGITMIAEALSVELAGIERRSSGH